MEREGASRQVFLGLGLLLLGALSVRLVFLSEMASNPFFTHPLVDADTYHEMARNLAAGKTVYDGPFFQPPGYPLFLGLIYLIFGPSIAAARLIQAILGVANVLLTWILGRRLFGIRVAFGAGTVMALYGTMIFYESELLAPVLIVFLNLLLLVAVLRFVEAPTALRALLCGLLLGASAVTMSIVLAFAPVAAIYAAVRLRREGRWPVRSRLLLWGVGFAIGIAAVIAPVTIRNMKNGEAVLISYNSGVNFYIGTGRDYREKVAIRPGHRWIALVNEPNKAGQGGPGRSSAYFWKKGLGIIRNDPAGYLRLLETKLFLIANGNEIMRNQEIYPFRRYSPVLAALLWKHGIAFPYGILLPLSVLGLAIAIRRRKAGAGLLGLFAASHVAVLMLFFITARYRLNLIPFLAIFAAYGVGAVVEIVRARSRRSLAISAAALVGLGVLSNWDVGPMPEMFNADAYFRLGMIHLKEGRAEAKNDLRNALLAQPDFPEAKTALAVAYDLEGDRDTAMRFLDEVLRDHPDHSDALLNKGYLLEAQGDRSAAVGFYRKALAADPDNQPARESIESPVRGLWPGWNPDQGGSERKSQGTP